MFKKFDLQVLQAAPDNLPEIEPGPIKAINLTNKQVITKIYRLKFT